MSAMWRSRLKAAPPNRLTPDLDKDRAMDAGPIEGARTAAAVRARFCPYRTSVSRWSRMVFVVM